MEIPIRYITISIKEYESLRRDEAFLLALEAAGVDNWEGYSTAWQIFEGKIDEEDI